MKPIDYFNKHFAGKKICILGMGREGNSTLGALIRYLYGFSVVIADKDISTEAAVKERFGFVDGLGFKCGDGYLDAIKDCDVVFKSPGLSYLQLPYFDPAKTIITSQTAVLLDIFRDQITGVTGTKGKSTTVSLLHHIYKIAGRDVKLAGNIGIAPFEIFDEIRPQTRLICELSSHQLEKVNVSPHTAILLNIFQEHLDHYASYKEYQLAKMNIARWQKPGDIFIYHANSELLRNLIEGLDCSGLHIPFGELPGNKTGAWCEGNHIAVMLNDQLHRVSDACINRKIPGRHNLNNIMAVAAAALSDSIPEERIAQGIATFEGLKHRLEFVAEKNGARFYNDSISTIPEATIEALKTFGKVQTMILGGHDRGVDYEPLINYLVQYPVDNLLFIGNAGERMHKSLKAASKYDLMNCIQAASFEEAVKSAISLTDCGQICLLSPAASSYDAFRNFEERGERFRQIIHATEDDLPVKY